MATIIPEPEDRMMEPNRALVLAVVGLVILAGGAAEATPAFDQAGEPPSDGLHPGERLSGILGVEYAEWNGEIDHRAFDNALANADADPDRAAVVAENMQAIEERLQDIERRMDELEAARERGELSEGAYRSEIAALETERRHAERSLNRSAEVAAGLPRDVLSEQGVNIEAINQLRTEAANMTGPEVAAIARTIAGPPEAGPPGQAGNRSGETPGPPEHAGPGERG